MPPKGTSEFVPPTEEPTLGVTKVSEVGTAAGPQGWPFLPDNSSGASRSELWAELASMEGETARWLSDMMTSSKDWRS